ncbi:hypothetical protein P4J63_29455, partial [Bacillus cereus]|nr:hypothetical protein [Bacillus cereus]
LNQQRTQEKFLADFEYYTIRYNEKAKQRATNTLLANVVLSGFLLYFHLIEMPSNGIVKYRL